MRFPELPFLLSSCLPVYVLERNLLLFMSNWKKIRYRFEWLGVKWLYFAIPLLPRRVAHALGTILGSLAFHLDGRGRRTALENLALVFGDEKTPAEIHRTAVDSYRSFARTVIDQFWGSRLNRQNFSKFCDFEIEDMDALERARETGAIWITPHYSNFEWIALVMGFDDFRFTIVAQDFRNSSLTETYKKNRERSGHEVISQRGATLHLLRSLEHGGHAAFLTDLTIRPSRPATAIQCFGRRTCVTGIHAYLMRRTGLPVIPGICIPQANGRYLMKGFRPLKFESDVTDHEIAQACWDIFEPFIRENPAPWLWMYKHWRYLPANPTTSYPSYASQSNAFEKVLERSGGAEGKSETDSVSILLDQ